MKLSKKKELVQKRRWRIRKKISGTSQRPRIAVRFTNKNIHAQCIDDIQGNTLIALSTTHADHKGTLPNMDGSKKLGTVFGEQIKGKGFNSIVFDRSGRK